MDLERTFEIEEGIQALALVELTLPDLPDITYESGKEQLNEYCASVGSLAGGAKYTPRSNTRRENSKWRTLNWN